MRISPQETLNATIGEFQEILDLIAEYDWDFDNYLMEDVPAAVKSLLLFSGKFLFLCELKVILRADITCSACFHLYF